jgi:hypothetical protein
MARAAFDQLREGPSVSFDVGEVRKGRAPRTSEARLIPLSRLSWKFCGACAENSARAGHWANRPTAVRLVDSLPQHSDLRRNDCCYCYSAH